MLILGIETSCDETGVAIYDSDRCHLWHRLHSQIAVHAKYGGVVPELASRDHIRYLLSLVKDVVKEAQITLSDIDAIAYTAGPGLIGALLVGASFAHALSFALKIPVVPVHHMEAHLLAPFLENNSPEFPFLALLISGGHTQLIEAKGMGNYQLLGESVDDAVGEVFDKVAKVLQLPYPGGPALEKLAQNGVAKRFYFPRPMIKRGGLNFSFSGLKTAVINCVRDSDNSYQTYADIAYAFQEAVAETFIIKCKRALKETALKQLVVAGGVSANKVLRHELGKMADEENIRIYYPRTEFCTDNGAMIAYAGWQRFLNGKYGNTNTQIDVHPRWKL